MSSTHPHGKMVNQFRFSALSRFCRFLTIAGLMAGLLNGCARPESSHTPTPPDQELVLYNWVDYMPQAVLDQFQAESGVRVTYQTYDSTEEAENNLKIRKIDFDVAVIENDVIPELIANGLLAQIDRRHLPNYKNISPNFRDLVFDPDNIYSVPNNWGTTGLLVRSDLTVAPITRWADLWDPRYKGKIVVRQQRYELITIALKSLGYHVNSEDPAQLEQALARLLELKKQATFVDVEAEKAVAPLLDGSATILVGWPGDANYARDQNPAIQYILPAEGTMLWGDSFIISAKSTHKETAELFLNFIMRPEIGAEIIKTYSYPNANETVRTMLDSVLANDPILFPPPSVFEHGEWYLPLSPRGRELYEQIWARFQAEGE